MERAASALLEFQPWLTEFNRPCFRDVRRISSNEFVPIKIQIYRGIPKKVTKHRRNPGWIRIDRGFHTKFKYFSKDFLTFRA